MSLLRILQKPDFDDHTHTELCIEEKLGALDFVRAPWALNKCQEMACFQIFPLMI